MDLPATMLLVLCVAVMALGAGTGALGLGIAVVAAPTLSLLFHHDMTMVVPLSLALNAATCIAATATFAPRHLAAWRHALGLGAIAAVFAPIGAAASRAVPDYVTWYVYLGAVLFLVGHLLRPARVGALPAVNWAMLFLTAVPAGLVGGFVGIGPGFAFVPMLVVAGMDMRHAAGAAALASILPSLTSLIPMWPTTSWNSILTLSLTVAAMIGTVVGASYASRRGVALRWQRAFAGFVAVFALVYLFTIH